MRVKAVVAYDGTDYRGFQRQTNSPTVQGELEQALARVTQAPTRVLTAGRTDAGVHAEGQVIAFDTDWRHPLTDLERAMNAVLPPDVAVRGLGVVEEDFHPRYAATSRHYRYTVYNAPTRSPLFRRSSWHVAGELDLTEMNRAAEHLVGEHDFASFGRPPQGTVTVRRLSQAVWRRQSPWLFFDIEANAFLYRMVRSIVATLLQVGQGRLSPERFGELLVARDRSQVKYMAPPQGLCLIQVRF